MWNTANKRATKSKRLLNGISLGTLSSKSRQPGNAPSCREGGIDCRVSFRSGFSSFEKGDVHLACDKVQLGCRGRMFLSMFRRRSRVLIMQVKHPDFTQPPLILATGNVGRSIPHFA